MGIAKRLKFMVLPEISFVPYPSLQNLTREIFAQTILDVFEKVKLTYFSYCQFSHLVHFKAKLQFLHITTTLTLHIFQ